MPFPADPAINQNGGCLRDPERKATGWLKMTCNPDRKATGWIKTTCNPERKAIGWLKLTCNPERKATGWLKMTCNPERKAIGWLKMTCNPERKATLSVQLRGDLSEEKLKLSAVVVCFTSFVVFVCLFILFPVCLFFSLQFQPT